MGIRHLLIAPQRAGGGTAGAPDTVWDKHVEGQAEGRTRPLPASRPVRGSGSRPPSLYDTTRSRPRHQRGSFLCSGPGSTSPHTCGADPASNSRPSLVPAMGPDQSPQPPECPHGHRRPQRGGACSLDGRKGQCTARPAQRGPRRSLARGRHRAGHRGPHGAAAAFPAQSRLGPRVPRGPPPAPHLLPAQLCFSVCRLQAQIRAPASCPRLADLAPSRLVGRRLEPHADDEGLGAGQSLPQPRLPGPAPASSRTSVPLRAGGQRGCGPGASRAPPSLRGPAPSCPALPSGQPLAAPGRPPSLPSPWACQPESSVFP